MHRSIRMILIGLLGVFFYNYFLFLGTARLKAQTAFVINELWPALIILFSCWILKEKMNPGKAAAVIFFFLEFWLLQQTEIWRNFRWEIPEVFFMH